MVSWKQVIKKAVPAPLIAVVLLLILTACTTGPNDAAAELSNVELFRAAVLDAMVIDDDEILPLVEISKDSELTSWDDYGRVLMLTFHRFPESYIAGEDFTLIFGPVWTFTDREIVRWYQDNRDGVEDWELRFRQLIGLPEERVLTHFSALWTDPDDIIRPGYNWRLSDTVGAASFEEEPCPEFRTWFNSNIIWSYFDSAYPWTRLGYTFDWAAGGEEYGLSEFLIRQYAVTQVEFTKSVDEFLAWLGSQ